MDGSADLGDHQHLLWAVCFYVASSSSGWHYLAGFLIVLALLLSMLVLSQCADNPAWLLTTNLCEEAKQVITCLHGVSSTYAALVCLKSLNKLDSAQGHVQQTVETLPSSPDWHYRGVLCASCSRASMLCLLLGLDLRSNCYLCLHVMACTVDVINFELDAYALDGGSYVCVRF